MTREDFLKNEAWNKTYLVSISHWVPTSSAMLKVGSYYAYDDCGDLDEVTEEVYNDFNENHRNVEYRLTDKQAVSVINTLDELIMHLQDISFREDTCISIVEVGTRLEFPRNEWVHSFKVVSVMDWDEFVRYVSNDLLTEFKQWIDNEVENGLDGLKPLYAYERWINTCYFPMKRADKRLRTEDANAWI